MSAHSFSFSAFQLAVQRRQLTVEKREKNHRNHPTIVINSTQDCCWNKFKQFRASLKVMITRAGKKS